MNVQRITTRNRHHIRHEVRARFQRAMEDRRIDRHEEADILDGLNGADAYAAVIDLTDGQRATSRERFAAHQAELSAWVSLLPETT